MTKETVKLSTKLYQKNLQFFQENQPRLYEALKDKEYSFEDLKINDDGDPVNIINNDEWLYPEDAQEYVKKQIVDETLFFRKGISLTGFNFESHFGLSYAERNIAKTTDVSKNGFIGSQYIKKFFDEGMVNYDLLIKQDHHPDFDGSSFFICFGLGLGYHIDLLFEKYQFASLIIFENQYKYIQHAAHIHDFSDWYKKCDNKLGKLIIVDSSYFMKKGLDQEISSYIYNSFHYPLFDNNLFFTHIDTVDYRDFKIDFNTTMDSLKMGRGFIEDEMCMFHNSMTNIFRNLNNQRDISDKILTKKLVNFQKLPLLIVANGPSLDGSIDVIKKRVAEGYMVMSCGSTLTTLLEYDIFPDIVVNSENAFGTYWLTSKYVDKYKDDPGWKNIIFIGFQTSSPALVSLFERVIYVLRSPSMNAKDIAQSFFDEDVLKKNRWGIPFTVPNVVNLALSAAIPLGFREIYCVGMDLGSKSGAVVHSKRSFYQKNEIENHKIKIKAKKGYQRDDIIYHLSSIGAVFPSYKNIRGNFGGMGTSNFILNQTAIMINDLLERAERSHFSRYQVYNCSDGRFIGNTTPLLPEFIPELSDSLRLIDKEEEKTKLFESQFSINYTEEVNKNIDGLMKNNLEVLDKKFTNIKNLMKRSRQKDIKEYQDFEKFIAEMMKIFLETKFEINDGDFLQNDEINKAIIGTSIFYFHYFYKIFVYLKKEDYSKFGEIMFDMLENMLEQDFQYVEFIIKRHREHLGKFDFIDNGQSPKSMNDRNFYKHFIHHLYRKRQKLDMAYPGLFFEERSLPYVKGRW